MGVAQGGKDAKPECQRSRQFVELHGRTSLPGEVERHRLCGEDVPLGIHHLDQHLVLAARHAPQDDGVALTVIRPLPGQVVDGDVQMSDARRHLACGRPAHGQDAQVLHPVRDEHDAPGQRTGERRLHDQPGRGLVVDGDDRALGEGAGGEHCASRDCGKRLDEQVHCILSFADSLHATRSPSHQTHVSDQ